MENELNEIYQALNSHKEVISGLIEKATDLEKQVAELTQKNADLEEILFEGILNPAKQFLDENAKEERFNEFNDKYGERLGAYDDKLKAIEGEDFSLAREAFDGYDGLAEDEKPESDEYVTALVEKVEEQLNAIQEAFGGAPVEAEIDENGDVEVSVDGEEVTDEAPVEEIEEAKEPESEPDVEIKDTDSDPDEMAAFQEELDAELEKQK